MSDLTPPLTPPDCNLQNFKFMPVDVQRLLKSDTWRLATDSEKAAMTALWYESWHEVPAGSLPNNERVLADAAKVKAPWAKVREQAMRGWRLCSDGRYYHPVVAEKALEAWIEKLIAQATGGAGNAKRWGVDFDAAATLAKLVDAAQRLRSLAPSSDTLKKKAVVQALAGVAPGSAPDHHAQSGADTPPESGRGRNRQGQGQGLENPSGSGAAAPTTPPKPKRKGTVGEQPAHDEPLSGPEQRSTQLWRRCPRGFVVTEDMVRWASDEFPILTVDDLRHETRAFRNHRYPTGRIEWVPSWENWIKEAGDRKSSRARPANGGVFQTERQRRVAEAVPGIAARSGPPPRTIDVETTDVTPRPAAVPHR